MDTLLDYVTTDKKERPQLHLTNRAFNYEELKEGLSFLDIKRNNQTVSTILGGVKACETHVTEKYGIFNFSEFLIDTIPVLFEKFPIRTYDLSLVRGIQEFKGYSDEFEIDGETFKPIFSLFSSTNTYYPLIICVGLFRMVCSNGMVVPFDENQFNVKLKHFSKSIPSIEEDFRNRLPLISNQIQNNIELIKDLKGNKVSYKEVLKKLLFETVDSDEKKTMVNYINRFSKNFKQSESDGLKLWTLNTGQFNALNNPIQFIKDESLDFEDIILDKYKVYNIYTEVFNKRNTSVITQENERILKVLSELN